ncbi:MAG: hypothetical protein GY807_06500 [Gammaproteobacteria bacterium]|nr:hypothetical protein [Gammaproteobacteria bacterium]
MRRVTASAVWARNALIALVLSAFTQIGHAESPTIIVLSSHNATPYKEMLKACQEHLKQQRVNVNYKAFSAGGDAKKVVQMVAQAKQQEAALIYSLGSLTTRAVLDEIHDRPIVAGLVLNADKLKGADNATGVILEHPLEVQFQWLQRLVPGQKTVGVLYNPAQNQQKITAAQAAARKLGLKLLASEVNSPKELPSVLDALLRRVDILWGVADQLVLSPKTAKALLLASFKNRIPIIGPSSAWVKAGAMYSLDRDYSDMGMQTGEMIVKILRGKPINKIPPAVPRKVAYSLNLKTAKHMKLAFPDTLVDQAQQVFK